jgi:hypothetical protein
MELPNGSIYEFQNDCSKNPTQFTVDGIGYCPAKARSSACLAVEDNFGKQTHIQVVKILKGV